MNARTSAGDTACAVDVYTWCLDVSENERQALAHYLLPDEAERASRFVFAIDRERFIAGRGKLRAILSRYAGCRPAELRFEYGAHGKPYIAAPDLSLHFNLSHSDRFAALAVSSEVEIGIDIEKIRPIDLDIADHYFSRAEVAALISLPADERIDGFFRCWTLKEAVIKGLGVGLALELASFDVSFSSRNAPALLRLESDRSAPCNWTLAYLPPPPGFQIALAAKTLGRKIALRSESARG
jgi:4'-phosphopantetheinyl transferase